MTKALRVLLVEDSATDAKLVLQELRRTGRTVEFERVETEDAMREALDRTAWDVVISDWSMPKFSAPAALAVLKESQRDLPFIIVSGTVGDESAVQAMRAGARDYVLKDKLSRLGPAVEREILEYENHRALREAERGRRDAERRSQRMIESAMVGMWTIDADGRTTFMNARMANILGREVAEAVSMPTTEFFFPEDRPALADLLAKRRDGLASAYEQSFRRADGSVGLLWIESSPMLDTQGRYEGVLGIVTDITKRRLAEDALRASEEKYRRIVETTNQGIWVINVDGKTTFANETMAQMLGCSVGELIGVSPAEFFDEEGRAIYARHSESRRAGRAVQSELRLLAKDGSRRWTIVESSPMHDALGQYDGAFAVVMDVTDRRNAQEALRESEARYRRLSESGIVGIIITDGPGQIVEANDTFLNMLGYSRDELGSGLVSWKAITPPEWSDISSSASEQLRLRGMARPWEKEYIRKDGSRVPVLVGVATLDDTKNISLSIDLTERKQAEAGLLHAEKALRQSEEQLRQAQKMEAVGRLAGGVAHDFNNVLSVILGYGEMLLADMRPDDPTRDDIEEIRKAGLRAADLTRQLLMFSRQQVLAPKVLDLNVVLANMDKMLQRILGADVDLVSLPTEPLGRVRADPSSMEQVIMNLVVNARDAMPTGGKLTMETANVVLDEAYAQAHIGVKPGPHVMLAVTDTGTGIEKATLTRIFEPFFTTKEQGKGTGLGLSTVFGVVQQSGGSVWVYSEVGQGTTFKVYLPRVDAAVDTVGETAAPRTLRGSETILLVEDDDQVRVVARGILRRSGYHVIDARNAGEALLHSEKYTGTIHLLLSDVVMPQVSGPELARRLATLRPDMKVLCMSGYTDDSIVRHGVLDAHIAYLQKPLTPDALTSRVREVLDGPVDPGSRERVG